MRPRWLAILPSCVLASVLATAQAAEPAASAPSKNSVTAGQTDPQNAASAATTTGPISLAQVSPGGNEIGSTRLLGFGFDPGLGLTRYAYTVSCNGPRACGPDDLGGLIWQGYVGHGACDWPAACWRHPGCAICPRR